MKKLTSSTVSDPDKSSFYFRAFKGTTTLLDSDDHLVSASDSSRWPKNPYYSGNRVYKAITDVSKFVMSSGVDNMLNSNSDFKILVNLEDDQKLPVIPYLNFYSVENDEKGNYHHSLAMKHPDLSMFYVRILHLSYLKVTHIKLIRIMNLFTSLFVLKIQHQSSRKSLHFQ